MLKEILTSRVYGISYLSYFKAFGVTNVMWIRDPFHTIDPGHHRSAPEKVVEPIAGIPRTTRDHLDASISQVGDPANQLEMLGTAEHEPPESDPLNATGHHPTFGCQSRFRHPAAPRPRRRRITM